MCAAMGSAFRLPVQQVDTQKLLSFFEDNCVTSVANIPGRGCTPPLSSLPTFFLPRSVFSGLFFLLLQLS